MATMRSLVLSPAPAAGLALVTVAISAPAGRLSPRLSAISGVTACNLAPSHGRLTVEPPLFAEATTTFTMLAGMAKPMPCEPPEREKIAVLMPTDSPAEIDQRAARIAGIDGGIGLDEELIVGDADLGARHRRDDAVGHGLADGERIADGKHDVADLQRVGIGEFERGETLVLRLDAQHREVGAGILEHHLGLEFALVGERDLDLVGPLDDVIVGHHEPGGVDQHARAERALHLLAAAGPPGMPKKRRKIGSSNSGLRTVTILAA